jgi:Gpi18-like mannosyltransferase
MSLPLAKRDLLRGALRFIETRLLIILIGGICYTIFPKHGQVYHQKNIRESIDIKHVWDNFDSHWYQKLAFEGYPQRTFTDSIQETWGFLPLYPMLIKFFSWIFGGDLFYAGIFVSNICTLIGLFIIYKLARDKFKTGVETVSLIMTCAGSFYLSIVYADGLFLLLTALVFYLSHKNKYGWALIIAGLASVARIQGCLLFIIPFIDIIKYQFRTCYKYIPAGIISLLPMAALMTYLYKTCGEPLAFIKIQHAWGSANLFPLQGFIHLLSPDFPGSSVINALFWVLIIGLVLSQYKKLPLSYLIFTLLYFLLSTSNEIVYGTTRYMLGVLPLFFAVSLSRNYIKEFFIILNLLFLGITIVAFVTATATFI